MDGVRVVGERMVPPDPSIAAAVGRHHSFETAVADLIDNSIDAGAQHVLVRFVQQSGVITGLRIVDDGSGMDSESIDGAMTFARKRDYGGADLGHFGLGLKAASLSQADLLRVFSRRAGAPAVGRSIRADRPTTVLDLDFDDAARVLDGARVDFLRDQGTVVEWVEPRTFLSDAGSADHARWLEGRVGSLMAHLGTVFHRLLHGRRIAISIDVFDAGVGESGVPRSVRPIDPFGYDRLTPSDGPREVDVVVGASRFRAYAHLWPAAQSGKPEFRLGGRPGTLAQGIYFYRGDRLLQVGGWNTLAVSRPDLELARLSIDLDETIAAHVTINPEKSGLELDADLKRALAGADFGGTDLQGFLALAEERRRAARVYTRRPVELVGLGRGFAPEVMRAFEESLDEHDSGAVDIRWRVERSESPLVIDLERRTIWLNELYRDVIVGRESLDAADAPFVKTLLAIVFSRYFEGSHLGVRERAEVAAWEELLTAALRDELAQQARRMGDGHA